MPPRQTTATSTAWCSRGENHKDGLFVPLLLLNQTLQSTGSETYVIPNPRQARARNLLLRYFAAAFFLPALPLADFLAAALAAGARRLIFAPVAVSPPAAWTTVLSFPRSARMISICAIRR